MHFRVIVVTDPPTHTQTHTYRQDRLQYTASQLAQSVNMTGHVQSENRHHPAKLLRFVEVSCPVREPGSRACTLNTRFFQLFRGSHGRKWFKITWTPTNSDGMKPVMWRLVALHRLEAASRQIFTALVLVLEFSVLVLASSWAAM